MNSTRCDTLDELILSLQSEKAFDHPVDRFELIQTHISYILLTGPFAYKLKKPVNLGFLDFSSLEKRKFFLDEELCLNKRLAPELYLEVVPICGSTSAPKMGGSGKAIEYALKLTQFKQEDQLDEVLVAGRLNHETIDQLVEKIANFHASIPVATPISQNGSVERIRAQVLANFDHIDIEAEDKELLTILSRLKAEIKGTIDTLETTFRQRKLQGFIRECHGDLHLTNMVLINNRVVVFDCIEFNETLRWIDVMSELAFLLMDLDFRQRQDLSARILNHYLELSGDYTGLKVLDFYRVYRSMVRAKVADISRRQSTDEHQRSVQREKLARHINLANFYLNKQQKPFLIITHGLSGSGKTAITETLLEKIGAVRIRSDVERKRLHGYTSAAVTHSATGRGIYRKEITLKVYQRLKHLTTIILNSGFSAIVDATFLMRSQREMFRILAEGVNVRFRILDVYADDDTLRSRIVKRVQEATDASEATCAVLEYQILNCEPLDTMEIENAIRIDTTRAVDINSIWRFLAH